MEIKVISLIEENPAWCRGPAARVLIRLPDTWMWNIFNIVVSAPIWIYFAHMFTLVDRSEIDLTRVKSDLNVNARMWTENDLNESEIDLNECEHFLKANLDWDEFKLGRWLLKVLNEFSVQFLEKNKEILSSKRFQYTLAFFLSFAYR